MNIELLFSSLGIMSRLVPSSSLQLLFLVVHPTQRLSRFRFRKRILNPLQLMNVEEVELHRGVDWREFPLAQRRRGGSEDF